MKDRIIAADKMRLPKMYLLLNWFKKFGPKEFAEELEKVLSDRIYSHIDMVTGLVQRRYFMQELTQEVIRQFPELHEKGILPSTSSIVVLVGDLAFLNFFNATSHKLGDEVLARTGKILLTEFSEAIVSRIGGDEFAIITANSLSDTLDRKKSAQKAIEEAPLNILDIEYATIDDIRALVNLHPFPNKGRRVKFVVQALTDIAMARAQIAKYYARIGLLVDAHLAQDGLYEELINYARKGAGNITDETVRDFARRTEKGEDVSLDCLTYALNVKAASSQGNPYEEAVFQVAKSIFIQEDNDD